MKKITPILILFLTLISCEDVINVDVPQSKQRLVIEASINWLKETPGNEQIIRLSLSTPFFEEERVPANGARIQITNSKNTIFKFTQDNTFGIYKCENFVPELNEDYKLTINYKDEIYSATEKLLPVTSLDFVDQKNDGGFDGKQIEIKAFCKDPAKVRNYYQFEFYLNGDTYYPTVNVYDDQFSNGKKIVAFYTEENLKIGDRLDIQNFGVSKRYYEFMTLLLQQGDESGGGPFQTQPATVRGNCRNITNTSNFPFGYFRLSQSSKLRYILK